MKNSLVFGAGRGPRLAVLELIKRSGGGMSVKELAGQLGMSYMGVKAHCIALASKNYLTTSRGASGKGRPKLLYKLADSGENLFADSGNDLVLDLLKEASGLYGATAPQKLLLMVFRALAVRYRGKISTIDPVQRAGLLARMRDAEGRMSVFVEGASCCEIRESHSSLESLICEYPETRAMEEHMMGEVIGIPVKRREEEGRVIFSFSRS